MSTYAPPPSPPPPPNPTAPPSPPAAPGHQVGGAWFSLSQEYVNQYGVSGEFTEEDAARRCRPLADSVRKLRYITREARERAREQRQQRERSPDHRLPLPSLSDSWEGVHTMHTTAAWRSVRARADRESQRQELVTQRVRRKCIINVQRFQRSRQSIQ